MPDDSDDQLVAVEYSTLPELPRREQLDCPGHMRPISPMRRAQSTKALEPKGETPNVQQAPPGDGIKPYGWAFSISRCLASSSCFRSPVARPAAMR